MYCQRSSRSIDSGSEAYLTGYIQDGVNTILFKKYELVPNYDSNTGALTFTNNYSSAIVGTPIYVFYEEMN